MSQVDWWLYVVLHCLAVVCTNGLVCPHFDCASFQNWGINEHCHCPLISETKVRLTVVAKLSRHVNNKVLIRCCHVQMRMAQNLFCHTSSVMNIQLPAILDDFGVQQGWGNQPCPLAHWDDSYGRSVCARFLPGEEDCWVED